MAGYCLGGVLAMLYACGHEDAAVRNLILMATPADFHQMGPMVAALREGRLNPEELIDETGNVPADVLYSGFFMIAPTTPIAQYATLLENLWNDEFVEGYQAMAQWSRDHVPFPGAAADEAVDDQDRRPVANRAALVAPELGLVCAAQTVSLGVAPTLGFVLRRT